MDVQVCISFLRSHPVKFIKIHQTLIQHMEAWPVQPVRAHCPIVH